MCERTEEADDEETRLTVGGELAEEHGHRVVLLHQVDHRKTANTKKYKVSHSTVDVKILKSLQKLAALGLRSQIEVRLEGERGNFWLC